MAFGLAPTALAGTANIYDKYRSVSYSNKGLMSESEEVQVGTQVHHQQVMQKFRLVDDPEIVGYVESVGRRVVETSARPDLDYHFFVVDDPSVNAFSIPGGYVYVHTGILNLVQSEDELAAVMAHEVAHVVARHGLRNLKSAKRAQVGVGIASILGSILTRGGMGGRAIGTGAQLLAAGQLTKHSRDFEREADYLGLYNMNRAGYNPTGMVSIFDKLGRANSSKSNMGGIFASHPDAKERVRNTQTELSQHFKSVQRPRRTIAGGEFASMKAALQHGGGGRGRDNRQGRTVLSRGGYDSSRDPRNTTTQDPSPTYNPPPLRRRP